MVLDEHNFLGTHTQYMSVSCVCVCLDKKHTYNNTHTYCCCSARSCVLVIIRNAFDILFAAGLVSILYIYLTCYLFVLLPLAQAVVSFGRHYLNCRVSNQQGIFTNSCFLLSAPSHSFFFSFYSVRLYIPANKPQTREKEKNTYAPLFYYVYIFRTSLLYVII